MLRLTVVSAALPLLSSCSVVAAGFAVPLWSAAAMLPVSSRKPCCRVERPSLYAEHGSAVKKRQHGCRTPKGAIATYEWIDPAFTSAPPAAAMTTILVDGIWCVHKRMDFYRHRLGPVAGPVEIFRYNSSGSASLDDLGAQLARHIRACSTEVDLVGFSMGGMVIRAAMAQEPTLPVRRVVFLCAPHRGSLMAYLVPWLAGCRQLKPGSDFLTKLDAHPWHVPTLNIWCPGDLMVVPGWSARMPEATEQEICWLPAHLWPLFSPGLTRSVAAFLARP